MAIINKKVGNTTYVCEVKAYRENGKVKHKWKTLGKLDADGNVIPSKKSASTEVVSLEVLKASLNSLDTLNSQNSQNVNATNDAANDSDNTANDSNDATVLENNDGNDTTITAATNATVATATNTTTSMPATPATATNKPIADTDDTAITAATTVADNSSDITHNNINNTSDMMSDTKTIAKTTPMATDNTSYYDIHAEASIDAVHIGTEEHVIAVATSSATPTMPVTYTEDTIYTIEVPATVPSTPEIVYDLDYIDYEGEAAGEATELVHEQKAGESEELSQRNLPQVVSKKPTHFKMGTTKVENTLFDPIKNESIYEATGTNDVKINVSRKNSQKKRIETLLYIDFNAAKANGLTISNEDRITPYDREIYNAVATLVAAGNNHISPNMIFQLLSGNTSSDARNKMSEETREKIIRSIYKMRATMIRINATAEVKACMMAEGIFEGYLIPAARVEIILNGQRIKDCIRIIDPLPLFSYANKKNQIASIDISLLDTPLNNTPENIELKAYLLRRILSMSNMKNNMRDVIRYDTIYQYLRITAPNPNQLKKKHKNIRDKTKILLDFWKGEELIKEYKEEREGKTIAKVTIYRY